MVGRVRAVVIALLVVMLAGMLSSCRTGSAVSTEEGEPSTSVTVDHSNDDGGGAGTVLLVGDPDHPWYPNEQTENPNREKHFTLESDPVEVKDGMFRVSGVQCGLTDPDAVVSVILHGGMDFAGDAKTRDFDDQGNWSVEVTVGPPEIGWHGTGEYTLEVSCSEKQFSYFEFQTINVVEVK